MKLGVEMPKNKIDGEREKKELINELTELRLEVAKLRGENTYHNQLYGKLWDSDGLYKSISSQIPVGVYRTSADGRIIFANAALAELLGYENVEDLLKVPVAETFVNPVYESITY